MNHTSENQEDILDTMSKSVYHAMEESNIIFAHIIADANVAGKLVELKSEKWTGSWAARRKKTIDQRAYDVRQGIVIQEFNPCNNQPGVILFSCGETANFKQAEDTRHVWLKPLEAE
jgi:hypothetical protein